MRTSTAIQGGIDTLLRWDARTLAAISRFERRSLDAVMRALTRAGDTPGWIVHGLVVFVLLRIPVDAIVAMTAAGVLATVSSQAMKRGFRRARPSVSMVGFAAKHADPDPFSFPSGHSSVAFAIATSAFAASPVLGGVELVVASAIASSRVYLGAHYPVDVLGGMALGMACGLATSLVLG